MNRRKTNEACFNAFMFFLSIVMIIFLSLVCYADCTSYDRHLADIKADREHIEYSHINKSYNKSKLYDEGSSCNRSPLYFTSRCHAFGGK